MENLNILYFCVRAIKYWNISKKGVIIIFLGGELGSISVDEGHPDDVVCTEGHP